jgi:hypothetical protein
MLFVNHFVTKKLMKSYYKVKRKDLYCMKYDRKKLIYKTKKKQNKTTKPLINKY